MHLLIFMSYCLCNIQDMLFFSKIGLQWFEKYSFAAVVYSDNVMK